MYNYIELQSGRNRLSDGLGVLDPTDSLDLKLMTPGARVENAQTDSGTSRGAIIAETERNLIQQISSYRAVVHRKDLLDKIPAVGENVRIAYSNDNARALPVKERSKRQELGR
jgi:hypothetical protein